MKEMKVSNFSLVYKIVLCFLNKLKNCFDF